MKRSMMIAALAVFSLAAVAASALGGAGDDQKLRALTRKVERIERDVRDLTKTLRSVSKSLAVANKEAVAVGKAVKALDDRSDERTLLLGKWFDTYHAKSDGRFHREAIRRIK